MKKFNPYDKVLVYGPWTYAGNRTYDYAPGIIGSYNESLNQYNVMFNAGYGDGNSWHNPDQIMFAK